MQEDQLTKLKCGDGGYLSVGITTDGIPRGSIPILWEKTASAYNMRIPNVYIAPEDLEDPEIMALLESYQVRGMYIFEPLEDYCFIARFTGLWDVFIQHGEAIRDLEFMEPLKELRMFVLAGPYVPNLEPLFPESSNQRIRSFSLCLVNCIVGDIRSMKQPHLYFPELVIGMRKGSDQRKRWEHIRTGKYTYYEY